MPKSDYDPPNPRSRDTDIPIRPRHAYSPSPSPPPVVRPSTRQRAKERDTRDRDADDDKGSSASRSSRVARDIRRADAPRDPRDKSDSKVSSGSRDKVSPRASAFDEAEAMKRAPRRRDSGGSDAGSVFGSYVRHRDGRVEYLPSDSEGSNGRRGVAPSARRRDDRDRDRSDKLPSELPSRRRDRERGDDDMRRRHYDAPRDEYGDPRRTAAPPSSYPRRSKYDDDDESTVAPKRRGSWRGGSAHYDDLGYDSERPSRRRYDDNEPSGYARRPPVRRVTADDDRGGERVRPSRRYADEDDDDDYRPRRDEGLRRTKSDRRAYDAHARDRRDPRDPRRPGHPRGDDQDWRKQGMNLFNEHAMPVIKREGGRIVMKQLQNFLAAQGR